MKLRANRKRKMGDDSFDELDDEIEGKRSYNVEEKLWADNYDADHVLNKTGQEVNYNFFQENGFTKPVLIKDSDGLGMMIPPESFTVDDVMSHVGADRVIEVMNALTQASKEWSMEEWVAYYNSSRLSRKKVLNVISLEFTGTTLDPLVEGPAVVREMDWVQKVWPLDLRYIDLNKHKSDVTFPKVLKYCLMSVGGCFTDFHIDLGGTSVWYHILKGKKVFWLIPPTEENLKAYETWSLSGEQEHSFLADACKGCQRIVINQGNTLLIPTGWIHAVYTPIDSLVFGGNFLHSFNIGLQLRIAAIEQNLKVGAKYRYPFFDEMQWYVYEHYNIALTGKSFSSIDGKATLEYCEVPAEPLLNSHELQGLRHLREWLGNQPDGSWPEDMENPKGLLTSMMIALSNHSGDPKLISAHSGKSLLQWKPSSLDKYKEQWKTNIMKTKIPKPVSNPPPQKSQPAAATKSPAVSAQRPSISSPNKVNSSTKERSKRCGRCKGCQAPNCTRCTYCKDMVKYGGTGRMRQSCIERVCEVVQSKTTKKNVSSGLVSAFDDEPEGLTGSGGPANDKHIARLVKIFNESTGDALTTSHGQGKLGNAVFSSPAKLITSNGIHAVLIRRNDIETKPIAFNSLLVAPKRETQESRSTIEVTPLKRRKDCEDAAKGLLPHVKPVVPERGTSAKQPALIAQPFMNIPASARTSTSKTVSYRPSSLDEPLKLSSGKLIPYGQSAAKPVSLLTSARNKHLSIGHSSMSKTPSIGKNSSVQPVSIGQSTVSKPASIRTASASKIGSARQSSTNSKVLCTSSSATKSVPRLPSETEQYASVKLVTSSIPPELSTTPTGSARSRLGEVSLEVAENILREAKTDRLSIGGLLTICRDADGVVRVQHNHAKSSDATITSQSIHLPSGYKTQESADEKSEAAMVSRLEVAVHLDQPRQQACKVDAEKHENTNQGLAVSTELKNISNVKEQATEQPRKANVCGQKSTDNAELIIDTDPKNISNVNTSSSAQSLFPHAAQFLENKNPRNIQRITILEGKCNLNNSNTVTPNGNHLGFTQMTEPLGDNAAPSKSESNTTVTEFGDSEQLPILSSLHEENVCYISVSDSYDSVLEPEELVHGPPALNSAIHKNIGLCSIKVLNDPPGDTMGNTEPPSNSSVATSNECSSSDKVMSIVKLPADDTQVEASEQKMAEYKLTKPKSDLSNVSNAVPVVSSPLNHDPMMAILPKTVLYSSSDITEKDLNVVQSVLLEEWKKRKMLSCEMSDQRQFFVHKSTDKIVVTPIIAKKQDAAAYVLDSAKLAILVGKDRRTQSVNCAGVTTSTPDNKLNLGMRSDENKAPLRKAKPCKMSDQQQFFVDKSTDKIVVTPIIAKKQDAAAYVLDSAKPAILVGKNRRTQSANCADVTRSTADNTLNLGMRSDENKAPLRKAKQLLGEMKMKSLRIHLEDCMKGKNLQIAHRTGINKASRKTPRQKVQRKATKSADKMSLLAAKLIRPYRDRRTQCGNCSGCLSNNCGKCVYCKDMVSYGGEGKIKQRCIMRVCETLGPRKFSSVSSFCKGGKQHTASQISLGVCGGMKYLHPKSEPAQPEAGDNESDVEVCLVDENFYPEDVLVDFIDASVENPFNGNNLCPAACHYVGPGVQSSHDDVEDELCLVDARTIPDTDFGSFCGIYVSISRDGKDHISASGDELGTAEHIASTALPVGDALLEGSSTDVGFLQKGNDLSVGPAGDLLSTCSK